MGTNSLLTPWSWRCRSGLATQRPLMKIPIVLWQLTHRSMSELFSTP